MKKKREPKVHRVPFTPDNIGLVAMGLKTQTRRLADKGYRRGDILLVNEPHHIVLHRTGVKVVYVTSILGMPDPVTYTAKQLPTDMMAFFNKYPKEQKKTPRPSMFMPNYAVRFVLKVEGVRHQQIKRMTWRDVEAEGVQLRTSLRGALKDKHARQRFAREVWNPINPIHPFDLNPKVTAVTFRLFPYLSDHSPMRTPDMIERDAVYGRIFGREGVWSPQGFRAIENKSKGRRADGRRNSGCIGRGPMKG